MNNSIDLKKRILKMRENNNIEPLNIKKKNKSLVEKKNNNGPETDLKKSEFTSIDKPNISSDHKSLNIDSNSKIETNISYDAQFRLLANNFNEAVEVILELSDSVKNLEKTVYLKDKNKYKNSKIPNLKIIVFIFLILIFTSGVIYLPINTLTFKLILIDIFSLI